MTRKARVDFVSLSRDPLSVLLNLRRTNWVSLYGPPFRQLGYIEDYLRHREIGCQSLVIENHYIDRDHMHDHSAFYSTSLHPYGNSCQRVHFFKAKSSDVRTTFEKLLKIGTTGDVSGLEAASHQFSREYLGFSVIKPLSGSPVGRTVLACYGKNKDDGTIRLFPSTRKYRVHVLGIELSIHGLAFQQQDLGVSACATTALWCSLQKIQDGEDLGGAVPAQITQLASRFTLPFGRPMPSEGLSVDQMCMAVQGLGFAPNLLRTEDFETGRGLLYSAIRSGFAPVLILERRASDEAHAVAVAGMNIQAKRAADAFIGEDKKTCTGERASQLNGVYVHDDRYGPYLRANLQQVRSKLHLGIDKDKDGKSPESWELTHLLIPSHQKIRLSFSALRQIALILTERINALRVAELEEVAQKGADVTLVFDNWVERNSRYCDKLLASGDIGPETLFTFFATTPLSRYIGIVRLEALYFGAVDVLIDSTSTPSNLHFLAIVVRKKGLHSDVVARHLSHECQCPFII